MLINRCSHNPILTPADVKPSREDFEVVGVFNCGAAQLGEETVLLCRVAESVRAEDPSLLRVPVVAPAENGGAFFDTKVFSKTDPRFDFSDPRTVFEVSKEGKRTVALTSLSHLRLARSKDGTHFRIADRPAIMPDPFYEAWGMEDPRITQIGEDYYVTYSSVAPFGVSVSMLHTRDFQFFDRMGVIFPPENKDVTIFPERINGSYYAFNRPVPSGIGQPNIWLASSPDLIHWGNQRLFSTVSGADAWDSGRIGGGAVPVRTPYGWLTVYHAADRNDRYCLGVYLLALDNPAEVIGHLEFPLLEPEAEYERNGFFGNVVFSCGAVQWGDTLRVYYGAADDKICRADVNIPELMAMLLP